MKDAAEKVSKRIKEAGDVLVVSHIDADGVSAAGIASFALDYIGMKNKIVFTKKLDEAFIKKLEEEKPELVWFTDLGSGSVHMLGGLECVITDHHTPSGHYGESKKQWKTLFDFSDAGNTPLQVNPHFAGRNGELDISGAGTTYLVARALDKELVCLAQLAVVGAVGDMQDRNAGRLTGTNAEIVAEGEKAGVIERMEDLNLFGRETRPLWKMLQYASDLQIHGITDDYEGSLNFFMELEIDLKRGEKWRTWADLRKSEKSQIVAALARMVPREKFIGEVYLFPKEKKGTPLHEAKEFATMLNSCGRYDQPELGLALCKGDRGEALDLAYGLRNGHKKQLMDSLTIIESIGITQMKNIQHVNTGELVRDTILGTVAGMLLSSGKADPLKPLFAMGNSDDGIKVSGRALRPLVERGLNLADIMKEVAGKLGGVGGGHNIAAGATIKPGQEKEFLELADRIVGRQIEK